MKFSGKICLKIILKTHKKPRFLPLFTKYCFLKTAGGQIEPPSRFRVKKKEWIKKNEQIKKSEWIKKNEWIKRKKRIKKNKRIKKKEQVKKKGHRENWVHRVE